MPLSITQIKDLVYTAQKTVVDLKEAPKDKGAGEPGESHPVTEESSPAPTKEL